MRWESVRVEIRRTATITKDVDMSAGKRLAPEVESCTKALTWWRAATPRAREPLKPAAEASNDRAWGPVAMEEV